MSSICDWNFTNELSGGNITTRRSANLKKPKMATKSHDTYDLGIGDSLNMDGILSQDEANDVMEMLSKADELGGTFRLPSFCTSTQTNRGGACRRPESPLLSPVYSHARGGLGLDVTPKTTNNELKQGDGESVRNWENTCRSSLFDHGFQDERTEGAATGSTGSADPDFVQECEPADPTENEVNDPCGGGGGTDLLTQTATGHTTKTITPADIDVARRPDNEQLEDKAGVASQGNENLKGRTGEEEDEEVGSEVGGAGDEDEEEYEDYTSPAAVALKLNAMSSMLNKLGNKSDTLAHTVKGLESSLEFSYKEIDDLKKKNAQLQQALDTLGLEDKRTQFQVNDMSDKLDKLETTTKRGNLIIEGLPEKEGKREDVGKVIWDLFDQMSVDRRVNLAACYRMGPFNKKHSRPILVSFENQADRDMVYSRRMELKQSNEYRRVWINEDLSQGSKRKKGLIRLITKEALQQGVDCKSGKYTLHINNTKYDENNLDDLPAQLHPSNLKQVRINDSTIAYQSEHAPFSNFFHCDITIGKHNFFCVEQAIQFLRARILNKPLAATKIYLSRDVRFIKQVGGELGTSEDWEARKYDYMYICLKKKFTQHPELKALLLSTGDLQLVEATPDPLWGCGATLSSNVLRRGDWKGKNKQGDILMTVRKELRQSMKKK